MQGPPRCFCCSRHSFLLLKTFVSAAQDIRNELTTPSGDLVFRSSAWHKRYMSGELQERLDIRSRRGMRAAEEVAGTLTQPRRARVPGLAPQLNRPHAAIHLGEYLQMGEIQDLFERVPADPYVSAGFRHKSIMRVHVSDGQIHRATHGPLFQPKEYNPIHGDIVRHYEEIDERLGTLLEPAIHIFAGCARLSGEHEVLVQTQRITASSGDDGHTGFPVVEGWHQDNISVLGLFLVNRVNVAGGISMLAGDRRGEKLVFAQTLAVGDLLLVDDTALWHNTTPIARIDPTKPAYRDIVIMTWPSCRETVTV